MKQNENTPAAYQVTIITQGAAHNTNEAAADQSSAIVQEVVNAKNNSAAIVALIPLQIFLHIVVVLTHTQCVSVAADGYEDFMEFENMQWDSIEKWISAARKTYLYG